MDTTTDAVQSVRTQRSQRPDPARVWAPLANVTDAAVATATGSRTVAITRGFDRNSRQRARALRDLLSERGIGAIEITPAPGSERLLAGTEVDAVINIIGAGSWQPYRLAAKLCKPMLVPNTHDDSSAADVERDVIGLSDAAGVRDAALSRVTVRPEDGQSSSLTVVHDEQSLTLAGGCVTVTMCDRRLEITLGGDNHPQRTVTADRVRIATAEGPHRLIRDELPIAEFEGELTLTAEPARLVLRRVVAS